MHITRLVFVVLQQVRAAQSQALPTPPPQTFWGGPAANWAVAIGTVILAFVAVFQEWIKSWFFKPVLDLDVGTERPLAEKTRFHPDTDVYYFRLAVRNIGRKMAEHVQVYAYAVKRKKADNRYELVDRFTPMALRWTHKRNGTLRRLLPGMPPVFCDLGHISDPARKVGTFEALDDVPADKTVFALETEVNPNSKGNLLGPGEYRVYLKIAASNCSPESFTVKIRMREGCWFVEEEQMYRDGIGLTLD